MPTIVHSPEEMSDIVAARMELVTKVNGYETDIGRSLYRGRRTISTDMVPCCVLIEDSNDVLSRPGRSLQHEVRQTFVLLAYVAADIDNPNQFAHAALRDLKRCVWKPDGVKADANFSGQVRDIHYQGHDMAPRSDGANVAVAALEIGVEYVEIVA